MSLEVKKYRVICPISNRSDTVYVQVLNYYDIHLVEFNGCDASFHSCPECEQCRIKTLKLHDQESDGEQKLHERTL